MTTTPSRPRRTPIILLIAMTIVVVSGPVGMMVVLRGGSNPGWPPDRPVEWAMIVGVTGLVIVLMILAISLALANQRAANRLRAERKEAAGPGDPRA